MRSYLRQLSGLAALVVALMTFAALPAAADLLKEIRDRGVFRVGMAETQPWQAPNPETGTYEGINVELAERAAAIMGVKLEIVPATWATLVPGLDANQFDAVFANLFATPERALVVDFTEPYFTYGFHIVVNADSKIQSLADLNSPDVTFVGQSGTVEESYPKELYPNAKVRGVVTNDVAAWISEVASGQADAAFLDPGTFRLLKAKNPAFEKRLRVLNGEDALIKPVGLAYAIRAGEPHFLNFLNMFLSDVVRNGENVKLRDKWFDALAKRQ